jgi:hypothetical protein
MRYVNFILISSLLLLISACKTLDCKPTTGSVLQGTDVATVGIYIDKNGYPQVTEEKVVVAPGQKIIFVGPTQFDILFKDQKSPIEKPEVRTSNSILTIEIPKDIFDREDRKNPANKSKNELSYRYGIRVNGKVTDPEIVVRPR